MTLLHTAGRPEVANATTANTINFQARLQNGSGAIVPDGTYNVEFKLYGASSGGSALWTEDYLNGNSQGVTVANGYLSVNLGSITAFSGINWDQKLWLTMNIGGTAGSGTYPTIGDGEMDPRLPLTAVPYAFSAGQLQTTSGSNTSKLSIVAPTGGNQTFQLQDQGGSGTFNILTAPSGSDGYVKLQGSTPGTQQTGNFNISGTGIAGTLQASTTNVTTIASLVNGGTVTIANNAATINVGTDNSTSQTINIGTGSSAAKYLTLGSGYGNSSVAIQAGTAGMAFKVQGATVASFDSNGNLAIDSQDAASEPLSVSDTNGTLLRTISSTGVTEVRGLNVTNNYGVNINNGALTIQGSNVTQFRTPGLAGDGSNGVDLSTKINIPIYNPGNFSQVIALGLPSSASSSSRAILAVDARTTSHQATIAVLSPDENQIFGLSWDGSSTTARIKTSTNNLALEANGLSVLTAQNVSGAAVIELGSPSTSNGKVQLDNASASANVTIQATGVTTTYLIDLPAVKGTAGQCLAISSVAGSTETLGYASCGGGGSPTLQDTYNNSATTNPQIQLSNTNGGLKIRDASSSSITNLLQVQNSAGNTTYLAVTTTGIQAPGIDSVSGSLAVGGTTATGVNLGNTTNTTALLLQGAAGATYTIGTSSNTGGITLGNSTATNTINIGNATVAAGNTGTINIGTSSTSTGKVNVTIGSTNDGSATIIQSGTGNLTLNTNSSSASIIAKSSTNGTVAFEVLNSSSVPEFVVDTSNNLVYIGNPVADATGALLVLDSKNTSGDPTGVNGAMYYNSSLGGFRCYADNHWSACSTPDLRTTFDYTNDMNSTSNDTTLVTDGQRFSTNSEAGHPGIISMSPTTQDDYALTTSAINLIPTFGDGTAWRSESVLSIHTDLSDSSDRYVVSAGFSDSFSGTVASINNGCFFKYSDNVNSGKWQGVCVDGGTSSTCDTGITAAADTWVRLTVTVNGAGTSAGFLVNGTSACQITTNIPTTNAMGFQTLVNRTLTTNAQARGILLDYLSTEGQFSSAR
ncbi:MAG TPA: hypothetical protein VLF40_01715 [Candidatus Saccharimonadales bacterium]|nr:hypothetical protein [Candidatus Saccharimonadales bacterium]